MLRAWRVKMERAAISPPPRPGPGFVEKLEKSWNKNVKKVISRPGKVMKSFGKIMEMCFIRDSTVVERYGAYFQAWKSYENNFFSVKVKKKKNMKKC